MGQVCRSFEAHPQIEVCKDPAMDFDKTAELVICVDLDFNGAKSVSCGGVASNRTNRVSMPIGNVESRREPGGRRFTD